MNEEEMDELPNALHKKELPMHCYLCGRPILCHTTDADNCDPDQREYSGGCDHCQIRQRTRFTTYKGHRR